ncbi:hypothetical protein D5R81_19810 [Parashewanella spongiae]|uniref:Uncharacterized protein n=2 Tax=Parashewanella spongiae TaxID=342950 RepID=A0A3A6T957_9GAMM|nr:hypothetical protein D5R81_19810 [Parashewanella spongiae]
MGNKYIFLLLTVISFSSISSSYGETEEYNQNESYQMGKIVKYENNLWINRFPVRKNEEPRFKNNRVWKKVQLVNIQPYSHQGKEKKVLGNTIYVPYAWGDSVIQGGKYFTYVGVISNDDENSPINSNKWIEFSHPALGFDIPIFDPNSEEAKSLLGIDSNSNEIRDDFELTIVMSDLNPEVKKMALNSGVIYGEIMNIGFNQLDISSDRANSLASVFISSRQCKNDLHKVEFYGKSWTETKFFNSKERLIAKFKYQNFIFERTSVSKFTDAFFKSCEKVKNYIESR